MTNRRHQTGAVTVGNCETTVFLSNHLRNLARTWPDIDRRTRRRHHAVKLARKQKPFKPIGNQHEVRVTQ